jgi:hypothetical protein
VTDELFAVVTDLLTDQQLLAARGTFETSRMKDAVDHFDDVAVDDGRTRATSEGEQLLVVVGTVERPLVGEIFTGRQLARTCVALETLDMKVLVDSR